MSKNKKIASIGLAMMLILLSVFAVYAASKVYEYSFTNDFSTGSVDLTLRQFTIDENGDIQEATPKSVLPGEHISYMPEVENLRADAYVRVKIDIEMDEETSRPITTDDIFTASDGWVQKGDYFYNTEIMKKGEKKIAFQGISVPDNWVQDTEGFSVVKDGDTPAKASGFTVHATADAVQAENFTPDFESQTPWGSIQIEEAKEEDQNEYGIGTPVVMTNEMTFSHSGGLEANTKDLFRNFGLYMAGDEYKDTLKITSKASRPVTIFFRTNNLNNTDLKGKMKLKIELDGQSVYDGDLFSSKLGSYEKLTKLAAGKTATFTYTVTLPEDSQNYYSVLKDNVQWMFKAVEDEAPKTEDNIKLALWFGAFIAAAVLLILVAVKARERKEDNDEDI